MDVGSSSLEQQVPTDLKKDRVEWRTLSNLLQRKKYETVAALLHEEQKAIEQEGNAILASSLAAARQLCLTCHRYRLEKRAHEQASTDAVNQESELQQQVLSILALVGQRGIEEIRERPETPVPFAADEPDLLESHDTEPMRRPGLWARVHALLGWPTTPQSSERILASAAESPARPVETKRPKFRLRHRARALPGRLKRRQLSSAAPTETDIQDLPSLVVYCLGLFRVYQNEQPIEEWPSGKGKSIFKHLIIRRERPVGKEILMELFWPGANPDAARNNLNVAIYGLRQALRAVHPDFSHVLFQDDAYLFNPALQIWVDVEEFRERLKTGEDLWRHGEQRLAVRQYRAAEALYQGELLEEDRYEEWLLPERQQLYDQYLHMLDRLSRYYLAKNEYDTCATICGKILATDPYREETHYRLMHCYYQQGQRYLALRQYHLCVEALTQVFGVEPSQTTQELYRQIRQR